MSNFFVTTEGAWDDGSVRLTMLGICGVIILIVAIVILTAVFRQRGKENSTRLTTRQIAFSSVAIAVAMVCSMLKLADLPYGGSITLFSMLFIVLVGYWYGPYAGIMTGIAYGLLQFVVEPIFYTIPQLLCDYPLAFGALGLSGLLYKNKKWGLFAGYILGVTGRYVFAVISGVVFFGSFAPENMNPLVYSLTYNATYIVPEAVATLILISLPPVSKALGHIRQQALLS